MIAHLSSGAANVAVCDPWADAEEVKQEYGIDLIDVNDKNQVDGLIVAVGHNEFRHLSASELRTWLRGEKPVLADLKSLFIRDEMLEQGFTVFRLWFKSLKGYILEKFALIGAADYIYRMHLKAIKETGNT